MVISRLFEHNVTSFDDTIQPLYFEVVLSQKTIGKEAIICDESK
ncbi:hypothetical protein RU98_GL003067 [Enterococcus caccae]|nr:hypothetical protein RU98_GL003067 [Enterococcus caccae]